MFPSHDHQGKAWDTITQNLGMMKGRLESQPLGLKDAIGIEFEELKLTVVGTMLLIAGNISQTWDSITSTFETWRDNLGGLWDAFWLMITTLVGNAIETLKSNWQGLHDSYDTMVETFKTMVTTKFEELKTKVIETVAGWIADIWLKITIFVFDAIEKYQFRRDRDWET